MPRPGRASRAASRNARQSFVTDPETYESVDPSPYVVAGQGPWGTQFRDTLRQVLTTAAGDGGNGSDGGGGGNP